MVKSKVPLPTDLSKAVQVLRETNPRASLMQLLPARLSYFLRKFPPPPFGKYADKSTYSNAHDANPFLPNKHVVTGTWHRPRYSLRRQSVLYKDAYKFGIEHLLPKLAHNKELYEDRYEGKTFMKGMLEFKLSKGERMRDRREKEVNEAVKEADNTIIKARGEKKRMRLERRAKRIPGYF